MLSTQPDGCGTLAPDRACGSIRGRGYLPWDVQLVIAICVQKYKGAGLKKIYLMLSLTDETYSLVCTGDYPKGADPHQYYFLVSLCNHIYWVAGSVLGSLIGSVLPFNTAGIDFAMTALFVTVFAEQWITTKEHRPALIGAGASVVCMLLFGRENFLIPAMIAITVLLTACRSILEQGGTANEQ